MNKYPGFNTISGNNPDESDVLFSLDHESAQSFESLNSIGATEDKYRTIFESIDEGYLLCKIIFDKNDKPIDAIFLETNSAFEFVTGIKIKVGSSIKEVLPNIGPFWISIPALVVKMGKALRHVGYVNELNRWMDVHFCRIGSESDHTVAVLVNNITERKQQEANVRFLADITSQFSERASTTEIIQSVGEKIGTYFGVSRCHFTDIDIDAGISKVMSNWQIENLESTITGGGQFNSDFISEEQFSFLQKGEAIVVHHVSDEHGNDPGIISVKNVESYITAPLVKDGKLKFLVTISDYSPRKWRRDEIELLYELASRIWFQLERLRTEEALRESEQKYRTLFESMDEGFAVCELVRDSEGNAIDYRYLQLNPVFEKLTGLKVDEAIGQLATKVTPGLDLWWIKTFQSIVETGVSKRFEHYVPQMGRWFDINAFTYGGNNFSVLYDDITKRKLSEDILLKTKEKKAFIIMLSDTIRELKDPVSIMQTTAALLGKQLSVNRVNYTEFKDDGVLIHSGYNEGAIELSGIYKTELPPSDFVELWKEGGVFTVNNVSNDLRISSSQKVALAKFSIASFISVGLKRNKKMIASLGVHSYKEHEWTPEEISLVVETAERSWAAAEQARVEFALRKSEEQYLLELEKEVQQRTSELIASKEQFSSLIENTPDIVTRWDKELKLVYANTAFESNTGVNIKSNIGKEIKEIVKSIEASSSYIDSLQKVFDNGVPVVYYNSWLTIEGDRYYYSRMVPERNKNGEVVTVLSISRDITEFKRAEQELLELKLKQQREIMNTVLATQEQERERIGESLHNGVAQLLYGIQTRMELINPHTDSDEKNITDVLNITRDAIKDIRKLSFELVPVVLKDFGIEVALKSLLGRIITGNPEVDLDFTGFTKRLPDPIEFAIYRIVQELVNNIIKHSKASKAKIELILRKDVLTLRVTDNGVGVSVNNDKLQDGIGLQSVKNRVQLLGGTMTFKPVLVGTSVEITIVV